MAADDRWGHWRSTIAAAAIVIGCALRLRWYLFDRSLWWAEAALSLNILRKPWRALLGPLDYNQAAPIGYLAGVKLTTLALGPGERALRLIPLLCGLAALPLFYAVARRYAPRNTALLALVFFAVSRSAVYWSSEAKQYMPDIALTLAALLVADWAMDRELTTRRMVALSAFGACALPCSFAMLFALPGIGVALAWSAVSRHDVRRLSRLCIVGGVWALTFGLDYRLSLRYLGGNDFLRHFWAERFLTLSDLHQDYVLLSSMFIVPLDMVTVHPWPVALLSLAGCVSLCVRDRVRSVALLAPLAFLALASAARLYPLWHRMILFTLPLLLLPAIEGVMVLARVAARLINRAAGLAVGAP